jgi:hypothetical protein
VYCALVHMVSLLISLPDSARLLNVLVAVHKGLSNTDHALFLLS